MVPAVSVHGAAWEGNLLRITDLYFGRLQLGGHCKDGMPGQKLLFKQLGVSEQTVELALQLLEKEELLVGQGAGRRGKLAQGAANRHGIRR